MFTMLYVRKFLSNFENSNQYIEKATQWVMSTRGSESRIWSNKIFQKKVVGSKSLKSSWILWPHVAKYRHLYSQIEGLLLGNLSKSCAIMTFWFHFMKTRKTSFSIVCYKMYSFPWVSSSKILYEKKYSKIFCKSLKNSLKRSLIFRNNMM